VEDRPTSKTLAWAMPEFIKMPKNSKANRLTNIKLRKYYNSD